MMTITQDLGKRTDFEFSNPMNFIPPELQDYFMLGSDRLQGHIKDLPAKFKVVEPVPDYPGRSVESRGELKFLTVGPESDMPGLIIGGDGCVEIDGRRRSAVAMTVVKCGETTWTIQDRISKLVSSSLERNIPLQQVLTSGLKDRKAVTAQTVVVIGVTMDEMLNIDWPSLAPGQRGYFVKDIRPATKLLKMGDHHINGFEIVVRCPGKSKAELDRYMALCMSRLEAMEYRVPNPFQRQRMGPGQHTHVMGRTLITGEWSPAGASHPFRSSVEAMMHRFLFEGSSYDRDDVRTMRREMQPHWLYDFEQVAQAFQYADRRANLSVECDVISRLADYDLFGGSCERVLYALRDRISLMVGAWQAFYWNWLLAEQLNAVRSLADPDESCDKMRVLVHKRLPLAMSCDYSERIYRQTELGRQCLRELKILERAAKPAQAYLQAFIEDYWANNRTTRSQRPDNFGLASGVVKELFSTGQAVRGLPRPTAEALAAAFVLHLFLVPRNLKTGQITKTAPARPAFVPVHDLSYETADNQVTFKFPLPNGAYATAVVGGFFDTSDPDEQWSAITDI